MKRSTLYYATSGENGGHFIFRHMPRVPMIYQQHPTYDDGSPILPHVWINAKGERIVQVSDDWHVDPIRAAEGMARWCGQRFAQHVGPICLNVESIPLDTESARAFWEPVFKAIREACPRALWGWYDRRDMDDLTDWAGPSIYTDKAIVPEGQPVIGDREWQTSQAAYEQVSAKHIAWIRGRWDKPTMVFVCPRVLGDAGQASGWVDDTTLRIMRRVVTTHAADMILWDNVESAIDRRRFTAVLGHLNRTW